MTLTATAPATSKPCWTLLLGCYGQVVATVSCPAICPDLTAIEWSDTAGSTSMREGE